jgi:hypothetical protein
MGEEKTVVAIKEWLKQYFACDDLGEAKEYVG